MSTIFIIKTTHHLQPGEPRDTDDSEIAVQANEAAAREYVGNCIQFMQPGEKTTFVVGTVEF